MEHLKSTGTKIMMSGRPIVRQFTNKETEIQTSIDP